MKKVSVIIPTYGRAKRIEECIESLIKQTYQNIEIIVVDDNPADSDSRIKTLEKLEKYKSNIKLILMERNSGACLARNKGILESEGELITFLDDDDMYYPDKIEKQVKLFQEDITLDFVACNMKIYLESEKKYKNDQKCILGDFVEFSIDGVLYTPMLMIRKEKLLEVNLFSRTSKFQDHLLVLKLLQKKMKYKIINESLFKHTIHSDERITYTSNYEAALQKIENLENLNLYKYNTVEKNLLFLKRIRLRLNAMQNLKERDYKSEFKLLIKYLLYEMKGCRKKEIKEGIKIIVRLFIQPKKLEKIKFKFLKWVKV